MRHVVTVAPGRMEVRETDDPQPGRGQALVHIDAVGLCGSDYHILDGSHPYAQFPQVQGHEVVGRVESLPGEYDGPLSVGERVAVSPTYSCGECFACRRGRGNCCPHVRVIGVQEPGGLADYLVMTPGRLISTRDLPARIAVLTEPMSIGLHSVNRAQICPGDRVVVTGAGPIGLAAQLAAQDAGAAVLVADRIHRRLDAAAKLGAVRTVDTASEDLTAAVAEFSDGDGATAVIEATGAPALVRVATEITAPSGTVVIVGISTAEVCLPVSDFSRKELNVLGARNSSGEFPAAVDLVARYADRLADLVTHEYDLSDAPAALEYARTHPETVVKAIVTT